MPQAAAPPHNHNCGLRGRPLFRKNFVDDLEKNVMICDVLKRFIKRFMTIHPIE